ncbi:MAG: cell division protein FtsZ [Candidatus Undinarchaeales archaeon]
MDFIVKNALNSGENPAELAEKKESGPGRARISVIGTGGAGCNSITRLMELGGVKGANTIVANTDMQHLESSKAGDKILMGYNITEGLGAGGYPKVGRNAAEASKKELREMMKEAHLVFLTCGLGGGTGTGSIPVIADIAKKEGAIVVATVTTPFDLEKARIEKAEEGMMELRKKADTVIVIDNNKLTEYYPNLPINQAFSKADELIASMIKGITETITVPSLMNLDFADVKTIMNQGGVAMIGVGESDSSGKVKEAVANALEHPLLDVNYEGANGALIHITGGPDMTLNQVTEAGELISDALDPSDPDVKRIFNTQFTGGFWHQLHKPPGARSGNRVGIEIGLRPDHPGNQIPGHVMPLCGQINGIFDDPALISRKI